MNPYFEKDAQVIYQGDCLEIMAEMPENSVDSIITDPPYGLEFMGKHWDHGIPGIAFWTEALRVAKPGAFMFAFGGTRTHHRLMVAIEDAGWIIRDVIMWVYSSGFKKGLDISKKMDEKAGAEREVVGKKIRLGKKKYYPRNPTGNGVSMGNFTNPNEGQDETAPSTPAARLWDGWGTGLAPSYEPIVVAMKPLEGGFVENAEKWGVGGLWVDGGRIEADEYLGRPAGQQVNSYEWSKRPNPMRGKITSEPQGRWPKNLIHDASPDVLREFDKAKGRKIQAVKPSKLNRCTSDNKSVFNNKSIRTSSYSDVDTSPARFYQICPPDEEPVRFIYCPKAGTSEKNKGEGDNTHPTVKPLSLIRYLARLSKTPTGGIILDPFLGSGTTLLAARAEGRAGIGIELEPDYCDIARRRLENKTIITFGSNGKTQRAEQLELF